MMWWALATWGSRSSLTKEWRRAHACNIPDVCFVWGPPRTSRLIQAARQRRRGGVPSHKRGASRVSLEAFIKLDSKVEEEIRAFERSLVGGGGAVKWKLVRETTHLGVPSAHSAYPVIRYVSFLAKLL